MIALNVVLMTLVAIVAVAMLAWSLDRRGPSSLLS